MKNINEVFIPELFGPHPHFIDLPIDPTTFVGSRHPGMIGIVPTR